MAHPSAESPANSSPSGSTEPCQGWVTRMTPTSARPGHTRASREWLRSAATVSGPRNSIATTVPRSMRAMAARNVIVTRPEATPSPISTGRSARRTERHGGRAMAMKIRAPAVSRSHAVPPAPTVSISPTLNAEPSCTDSIEAMARLHGGTRFMASRRQSGQGGGAVGWRLGHPDRDRARRVVH